jgi:hypothetical protein
MNFGKLNISWRAADTGSCGGATGSPFVLSFAVVNLPERFTHVPTPSTRGPQQVNPSGPGSI